MSAGESSGAGSDELTGYERIATPGRVAAYWLLQAAMTVLFVCLGWTTLSIVAILMPVFLVGVPLTAAAVTRRRKERAGQPSPADPADPTEWS